MLASRAIVCVYVNTSCVTRLLVLLVTLVLLLLLVSLVDLVMLVAVAVAGGPMVTRLVVDTSVAGIVLAAAAVETTKLAGLLVVVADWLQLMEQESLSLVFDLTNLQQANEDARDKHRPLDELLAWLHVG